MIATTHITPDSYTAGNLVCALLHSGPYRRRQDIRVPAATITDVVEQYGTVALKAPPAGPEPDATDVIKIVRTNFPNFRDDIDEWEFVNHQS